MCIVVLSTFAYRKTINYKKKTINNHICYRQLSTTVDYARWDAEHQRYGATEQRLVYVMMHSGTRHLLAMR